MDQLTTDSQRSNATVDDERTFNIFQCLHQRLLIVQKYLAQLRPDNPEIEPLRYISSMLKLLAVLSISNITYNLRNRDS